MRKRVPASIHCVCILAACLFVDSAPAATQLGIGEVLRIALQNAPALTSAQSQVGSASGRRLAAIAAFLPSISVNDQTQRYRPYRSTGVSLLGGVIVEDNGRLKSDNIASAQFSLNLFDGGKDKETYLAAARSLDSANLGLTAAMDKLFQQLLSDFVAAITDQLKINSNERVLALDNELLDLTRERVSGQFASRLDWLQSEQQVLTAKAQLAQERRQEVTDLASLYADMGLAQSRDLIILVARLPRAPEIADARPSIQGDPEVQAALAKVRQAEHEIATARAGYYPTLSVTGQYDFLGESRNSLMSAVGATRRTDYYFGLSATIPISSFLSVRAAVDQDIAKLRGAQGDYQTALVDAANRAAGAPRQLDEAREALEIAGQSEKVAGENASLTLKRYAAKQTDRIDVEKARILAEQAELTLETSRFDASLAEWEMLRAARPRDFPSDLLNAVISGNAGERAGGSGIGEPKLPK